MQLSEKQNDKPYPRKLIIEQGRMHELLDELNNIPREKFIGAFKFDIPLTWRGRKAGYIVAKLKDSEILMIKLKFDLKIEKLKRSPNYMFSAKDFRES